MPVLPVTFFYPYPAELNRLESLDLRTWRFWSHEGKERRRAWILQTYLWLRESGYEVDISATLPEDGLVVLLPERPILDSFMGQYGPQHRSLLIVTVRADIMGFRSPLGDADIVQNGRFADGERTFFVPHWPQPGLIPRDAARGDAIKHIVFKGGFGSLREDFRPSNWKAYLEQRGLTFEVASAHTQDEIPRWHDYSSADLTLAVRPSFNDGGLRYEKPASKLVNAWHAGVPALLGPEYAYRELRESPLDYIEIDSVPEAKEQIDRLRENPALYRRMIEHGRGRAQSFTPERVAERWAEVLFEAVPRLRKRFSVRASRPLPLALRRIVNWVTAPPSRFEARKQAGYLLRHRGE